MLDTYTGKNWRIKGRKKGRKANGFSKSRC